MEMNNLKEIRSIEHLSFREISSYTKLNNVVLVFIQNEDRPFKQNHITILTSFFNVTTDYLLGNSDKGIIAYYNGEPITLTASEYKELKNRDLITSKIVDTDVKVATNGNKEIELPTSFIYRDLSDEAIFFFKPLAIKQINDGLDKLSIEKIHLVLAFVNKALSS